MGIVRWDGSDPAVIRACHKVAAAADAADDPCGPPMTLRRLHGWLAHPFAPTELWVAEGAAAGGIRGWCLLRLPDRENLDRGLLDLFVHPASRRGGIGGALLRHTAERAAAHGRSALAAEALQDSAGAAFAAAVGATPGLVEARRVLALGEIPAGRIAVLREQAARAAAGYSLVSWQGRTPDRYLAGFAEVLNAANDMPRDVGEEEEVWDAERVREQVDGLRARRGSNVYTIAALHTASGEMSALTDVEADPESPQWGFQLLTAVTRPHRGHRLGLLVKTAMLEWLAVAEPRLERIVTGNAAVNQHMIAINEQLGYELLEPPGQSYEIAVADLRRLPAVP
jgi:GNAT superfamily N-acetyltransferase/RimJ/RimL family protein N-acetyltransferase